jgi:hypothetical protein
MCWHSRRVCGRLVCRRTERRYGTSLCLRKKPAAESHRCRGSSGVSKRSGRSKEEFLDNRYQSRSTEATEGDGEQHGLPHQCREKESYFRVTPLIVGEKSFIPWIEYDIRGCSHFYLKDSMQVQESKQYSHCLLNKEKYSQRSERKRQQVHSRPNSRSRAPPYKHSSRRDDEG